MRAGFGVAGCVASAGTERAQYPAAQGERSGASGAVPAAHYFFAQCLARAYSIRAEIRRNSLGLHKRIVTKIRIIVTIIAGGLTGIFRPLLNALP